MDRALIIVPTYNERDNVEPLAQQILEQHPAFEVLFVDDSSPDGTGDLVRTMSADTARIHSMHRPAKSGLGTAYVDGFRWALARDYQLVFEMDADFSHHPKYLVPMAETAMAGADMVVGSRYVTGGGTLN